MRVEVITATEDPINVISLAAGCSYGKNDVSNKRVQRCFDNGHMSVFEHAYCTLRITGISRACCDQLTRHRMASFVVKSQRYTKPDDDPMWYVIPPSVEDAVLFGELMEKQLQMYEHFLADGLKPEDARFLIPMAAKANVVMTINVRELFHMFDMRLDQAAQWEIRGLFERIMSALEAHSMQWMYLMDMYCGRDISLAGQ